MEKFVKLRKIGEGSFGKAFLVKCKKDGGQLVVKEIGIMKMNAREREESRKEVAVLAQLNHPNIVTYRESFEEQGSLYIVMDYCAGGDLYSRISGQRGILFHENQVLDWFVQICLALKHIHDRKILHRDIKSQNIFLTTGGRVKLGDFGIAKVLNSTVELARTCIGTPYYLSPEICENKPYNNKSDVWSLGCVLYEMATLKHAFECGNMKNLVLKIIRGNYPPVHCRYSYEMRNLIAQLFKRSPRDRPSINSILKKPFLRERIQKFLSDSEYSDEFSHTVMHGMKIKKKLVPAPGMGGRPPPALRPPSAGKARPSPTPRYDPSNVYGKPAVRRSRENRDIKDISKRPGSAENRRPLPKGPASLEKQRQELIAREKRRQEEARKKQYEKKHQELIERQKMARMNRAREDGWRNLLGSGDSDKQKDVVREKPKVCEAQDAKLNWPTPKNSSNQDDKGKYDHYNAYLDQMQKDREKRQAGMDKMNYVQGGQPARPYQDAPRAWTPAEQAVRQAEDNRMKAGEAAERAKLVEDFIQRKKQAAANKARGHAEIMGRPAPVMPSRQPGVKPNAGTPPFAVRNKEEQEYLQNLRKIRLQNFNERHKLQGLQGGKKVDHSVSQEERKKKISALKEQADQRAHQLKINLEREAFERKLRLMENQRQNAAPPPRDPMKYATPAAAAPLTKVLQQIGVVPEPSVPKVPEQESEESLKQKQAEAIKKNLKENPPEPVKKCWGVPTATPITEAPESARSQWGDEYQTLSGLPLEQTASQQSEDSESSPVIVEEPMSARSKWAGQAGTVLNVLKDAKISNATVTLPDSGTPGNLPVVSGKLFDKVHLFEEEGEMVERGTKISTPVGKTVTLQSEKNTEDSQLKKSGLLADLKTGCFDVRNAQILRTCSEPDLAKLFKTIVQENSFGDSVNAKTSKSLELNVNDVAEDLLEDEGEIIEVEEIDEENEEETSECQDKEDENKDEEREDNGVDEEEEEDFRTVRESMASLLTLANDDDEDDIKVVFSLTDRDPTGDKTDGTELPKDDTVSKTLKAPSDDNTDDIPSDDESEIKLTDDVRIDTENDDSIDDTNDDIEDIDDVDESNTEQDEVSHNVSSENEYVDAVDHPRGLPTSFSQLFESDDDDDDDDDDGEDEYDVFSHLEESRMELEKDLGCDKFLKAYKAVQAVHEDEDEDIEAGTKIAINILGSKHEHLYPKIFQLVMADTAFTEDNS